MNDNNFDVNIIQGTFTITKASLIITTSKDYTVVYGDNEPLYDYSVSGYKFTDENLISGVLSREAGNQIGIYNFTLDDLILIGNNYELVLNSSHKVTVIKKTLEINLQNADKTYLKEDPEFEYVLSDETYRDELSLVLIRTSGEEVGQYIISVNSVNDYNFNLIISEGLFTINKATGIVVGNEESINGYASYSTIYNDNSVLTFNDLSKFTVILNGVDVTNQYDIEFDATSLDLASGGTTFFVPFTAISKSSNLNDINTHVIYKFKSVLYQSNYYTIEDALSIATTGTIIVAYNTSFTSSAISEKVYDGVEHTVRGGVTLLVPFNNRHSTSVTSFNDDGLSSNRTAYAQLTIQSGLELNVFGILTVNATRTHSNTVYMGFTDFNNYSQINIEEAAAIVVYGTLNVIGYITGEGKVEAKSESNILETLFIKSFRGGTITSGVYGKVFPFNQYTANNIESKLIINVGAIYKAATAVTVSIMGLQTGNIPLVGNTNGYLLNLKDGQIIKTYNTLDGTVELDVQGHADFNPITVSLSVTASSANKELPFDGTWNFKISEGSTLTIKKWCMDWFLARIKS